MKKMALVSICFATLAVHAGPNDIKNLEKREACKAIMQHLDYDEGLSFPLCIAGEWMISDVEEGRGNRQVAFSWKGKISRYQGGTDKCSGYVYSFPTETGARKTQVIDLTCQ